MKTKTISFNGKDYECRVVKSYDNQSMTIGSLELLDALQPGPFFGENEGFASVEAAKIYDKIFYFVTKDELKLPERELKKVLIESNPDWFLSPAQASVL